MDVRRAPLRVGALLQPLQGSPAEGSPSYGGGSVNINIEIPDEVYKKVKLAAILQDKTAKQYIIEQLEAGLKRRDR